MGLAGEAHHFLGEADLEERDYPAAIESLKRAVAENPQDAANHQLLARVYRAIGDLDHAASEDRLARASADGSACRSKPGSLRSKLASETYASGLRFARLAELPSSAMRQAR